MLTTLTLFALAAAQDGPVMTAPRPMETNPSAQARPVRPRPESRLELSAFAETVRGQAEEARREAGAGDDFDTALARTYAAPGPGVPEWAFTDRARWERVRCGDAPEEACLREARNALALARAERAERAPVERTGPTPERCRNVWTPSAEGVGGSFSRICGDEAASAQLLEDMRRRDEDARREADRDCVRRPETTDQGVRWTLVCGSPTNRERANDALDSLLR